MQVCWNPKFAILERASLLPAEPVGSGSQELAESASLSFGQHAGTKSMQTNFGLVTNEDEEGRGLIRKIVGAVAKETESTVHRGVQINSAGEITQSTGVSSLESGSEGQIHGSAQTSSEK